MAKQTQRAVPKSKPITSNPLFPAVIALWFGALFGLSSLAVRVSVMENLVLKSGIDLIVPAAAPPLGVTARILVALVLAALGALLGAMIGRRLARPKVEVRERKRSAKSVEAEQPRARSRDNNLEAQVRKPISAHEEFGDDSVGADAAPATSILANRRRALTAEHEPEAFVPQEIAPLPGGEPQILDLAGAEIDQPVALAPATPPAFAPTFVPEVAPVAAPVEPAAAVAVAPDLNAYEGYTGPAEPAPETIWSNTAPIIDSAPQSVPVETPVDARQVFQPAEPAAVADTVGVADTAEHDAHLQGRQVFGMAPVEPLHPDDRQVFAGSTDAASAAAMVQAAGFQTSVFDAPPAQPLFAERAEPIAAPADAPVAAPVVADVAPPSPPPAAQPLPPLPLTDDMGMTDLAERLKESMARRRAARGQASPTAIAAAEAAPAAPPLSRLIPEAPVEQPAAVAAPAEPAFPKELPAALRPLALDAFADEDEDDGALASLLPPRHIASPPASAPVASAAPIAFDPPVAAASATAPVVPVAFEAPVAASAVPVAFEPPVAEADDEAIEEQESGYASLLNVAPAPSGRPSFVRIEEPEAETDTVEPVVIFPGQGPRVPLGNLAFDAPREVAPVVSPAADEPASFRRFDAPATAGQGQPVAANVIAPALDADEAERSLRSALANLQRISGAA